MHSCSRHVETRSRAAGTVQDKIEVRTAGALTAIRDEYALRLPGERSRERCCGVVAPGRVCSHSPSSAFLRARDAIQGTGFKQGFSRARHNVVASIGREIRAALAA